MSSGLVMVCLALPRMGNWLGMHLSSEFSFVLAWEKDEYGPSKKHSDSASSVGYTEKVGHRELPC